MPSREVSKKVQAVLDQHSEVASACFRAKDFEGFERALLASWDALPEPKERWEESFRLARMLISFHVEDAVDFAKAQAWLQKLEWLDGTQQQHPGEVSLMKGKIHYRKGELAQAQQAFEHAYAESEAHCFGEDDEVYERFFRSNRKRKKTQLS